MIAEFQKLYFYGPKELMFSRTLLYSLAVWEDLTLLV